MQIVPTEVGKFLDPDAIIAQLDIKSGSMVADFGSGPGYFSLPFAKIIGEEGKIYSLDVLPQALESISSKARLAGFSNVVTMRVNLENENGSKLAKESLDWIILKDVLFQNNKKENIIKEAYSVLKPGGRMLVIEWNQADLTVGPQKEVRIKPIELKTMFEKQNFKIEKDIDAGSFHFAFVALK